MAQKHSSNTRTDYTHFAEWFSTFLGNKSVTKATYIDVLGYLASVAKAGKSYCTIHHHLHGLRIFYDFLDFAGLITEHAPRMVRMKAAPRKIPVVLNERQVVRLIAAARNPRERVIAEVLYATGCRVCELVRIKIEDIDFEGQKIRVTGKRQKSRFVLFGTPARRAIRTYLQGRNVGYLIDDGRRRQQGMVCATSHSWMLRWRVYSGPGQYVKHEHYIPARYRYSRRDARVLLKRVTKRVDLSRPPNLNPIAESNIWEAVKKMAKRAGMPWVNPQMLRHTFATHLLDHNAHLRVIQNLMGHESIDTTQIYTHVSRTDLRKTYERCHPRGKG